MLGKTSSLDRVKENMSIFDFELNESEMENINKLNKNLRYFDEKSSTFLKYPIFK